MEEEQKTSKARTGRRRQTMEEIPSNLLGGDDVKGEPGSDPPSLRQNFIGMLFGGGGRDKANSDDINISSDDAAISHDLDNTKKGRPSRRRTVESIISLFSDKSDKTQESIECSKDEREAIWINRKDGCVDIQKECRKLYSEGGNDKPKDSGPRRPRRRTVETGEDELSTAKSGHFSTLVGEELDRLAYFRKLSH